MCVLIAALQLQTLVNLQTFMFIIVLKVVIIKEIGALA